MRARSPQIVVWALVLLLVGCRTQPALPPLTDGEWETAQRTIQALEEFALEGKLGTPNGSANFHWQQAGEDFSVRLWGPLGQGTTLISGSPVWIELERAGKDGKLRGEPAEILKEQLALEVPVGSLRYWIRGVPEPRTAVQEVDRSAGEHTFKQGRWQVRVVFAEAEGLRLPKRLIITRSQPAYRVIVSVSDWKLSGADAS